VQKFSPQASKVQQKPLQCISKEATRKSLNSDRFTEYFKTFLAKLGPTPLGLRSYTTVISCTVKRTECHKTYNRITYRYVTDNGETDQIKCISRCCKRMWNGCAIESHTTCVTHVTYRTRTTHCIAGDRGCWAIFSGPIYSAPVIVHSRIY